MIYIYIYIFSTPDGITWIKARTLYCSDKIFDVLHATLAEAKDACFDIGALCSGIYGLGCENSRSYTVCTVGGFTTLTDSACVFVSSNQPTLGLSGSELVWYGHMASFVDLG